MVSYQSGFADLIEKYVFYQESSGSWSEVRARNLRYFDRFCAERFPGRPYARKWLMRGVRNVIQKQNPPVLHGQG